MPTADSAPTPDYLLDHATRVVYTGDWMRMFHDYYWLSDHAFLFTANMGQDTAPDPMVCRYDTRTRRRRAVPALARQTYGLSQKHSQVALSPDRRSILWADMDSQQFLALGVDGYSRVRWPLQTGRWPLQSQLGYVRWMPDSRHWVDFQWGGDYDRTSGVVIHDRRNPQRLHRTPAGSLSKLETPEPFIKPDGSFLVNSWDGTTDISRTVAIYEGDMAHRQQPLRRHKIALPPDAAVSEAEFSPSGDRIAWLLESETGFGETQSPSGTGATKQVAVWVCRTDGRAMRCVGRVTVPLETAWYDAPKATHWLPNEKRLSFLYGNALWTVPVEPSRNNAVVAEVPNWMWVFGLRLGIETERTLEQQIGRGMETVGGHSDCGRFRAFDNGLELRADAFDRAGNDLILERMIFSGWKGTLGNTPGLREADFGVWKDLRRGMTLQQALDCLPDGMPPPTRDEQGNFTWKGKAKHMREGAMGTLTFEATLVFDGDKLESLNLNADWQATP